MRVRGLKLEEGKSNVEIARVAPHAGAGIETWLAKKYGLLSEVAPHAGAGIETWVLCSFRLYDNRRTPCGCGD